jgi:DNA-binding protein
MKTALVLITLSLTFASTSFASESISLTIKTHEILTLKKVSKSRFEKISDAATGLAKLDFNSGSLSKNLMSQEVNETDTTSQVSYEVTGKNILKIVDSKEAINKEVQADINKSFFGNIKSIKISSETMQSLYAASMKKSGLDVLKNLRFIGGGAALTSSIVTSDMDCKADGDLLVCEQDATLSLGIEK